MLQTVKKGSSLHADARSTARIAEAACEPKSRMRANARRARDGAARSSRRACGVGLERDGGTRYRHREGRGSKPESETQRVRARIHRTNDGAARLSRRASGVGLERHGRHALSRTGRTRNPKGESETEAMRARPPGEVRPGEVEPSRIRRRARAPRASRGIASRKDGDGKRNRNRKECARAGRGTAQRGCVVAHPASGWSATGVTRYRELEGWGPKAESEKEGMRAHARRTRYGAAMPSRRASRAALTRHGRDAVSRRERQGGKLKRRRSSSLRQQRRAKAALCIARHSNRRRQPQRPPAEQHRHTQTAQIPTFRAFRISRNPSNAIAPAATRSTHFFARR